MGLTWGGGGGCAASSKPEFPQLREALCSRGTPPCTPEASFPSFIPRKIVCHQLGRKFTFSSYRPQIQPGRYCSLALKTEHSSWTFMVREEHCTHAHPHLASAPAWPRPAAQKQLCTSSPGSSAETRSIYEFSLGSGLFPMAPSHSPAALPHPMQPWLGRSVCPFLPPPLQAESPLQPPSAYCPG